MQETPKVDYLLCEKGGYHFGQSLNMVCLEQACQESMLCCCACIEEDHKDHNAKPLRLVLQEAGSAVLGIVPSTFNIDIALDLINSNLKQSVETFHKYKKQILDGLQSIDNSIVGYYSFLVQQVKLKNIDPKAQMEKAFLMIQSIAPDRKEYFHSVKRVAGLISVKKQEKGLSQTDILASLSMATDELKKGLTSNMDEVVAKTKSYLKVVNDLNNSLNIWRQSSFKFSANTKHPDIKVLTDHIVKSANSSGYKFAVLEPGLQSDQTVKEFAFKVKESSSNWVAVGMCHKNLVATKNYGFNFSAIGHGAYMVSANGGSWSNIRADQNNSIKAFKFSKGDIISVRVNFQEKSITFKRNNDKYSLNFETISGDELCPCVLFYYMNDEVQFLTNYKF